MDGNYIKGQILLLDLIDECFVGEFHYMDKKRSRIELKNVCEYPEGKPVSGIQLFYKNEIRSIKIIKDNDNGSNANNIIDDNDKTKSTNNKINIVNLTKNELDDINNTIENAKYVCQADNIYFKAIKDMRRQNVIAINIEGCSMGRNDRTLLLTVFTGYNVYLFDIINLGGIHKEIKEILEANIPRKIVHDGRYIADNLKFQENIQLNSVFDTLVAHISLTKEKTDIDILSCLTRYINVPTNFISLNKEINWDQRPLTKSSKIIASKKVIFIYKLYDILLHDYVLKDFYKTCNNFIDEFRSVSDSVVGATALSNPQSRNSSLEQIECDFEFLSLD